MALVLKVWCSKHPDYKAIQRPRSSCLSCAEMYATLHRPLENPFPDGSKILGRRIFRVENWSKLLK